MNYFRYLLNREWWTFIKRYRQGNTPWDTQITPPEVMAFLETATPGRALDLGCGTGTNAITMTQFGWQVTGIDYIPNAVSAARKKAVAEQMTIDFRVGDVTRLDEVTGPFDYVLDIGCLHVLQDQQQQAYAATLDRLTQPGSIYMLYAWLPTCREGRKRGISPERLHTLLEPSFRFDKTIVGEESGSQSAWYWLSKAD